MNAILKIKKLILPLYFGVLPKERLKLQDIEFNITIAFNEVPKACRSDKIEDTLCYDKLAQEIKIFCNSKEFYLIEHLGFMLHEYIKNKYLSYSDRLTVEVCKFSPTKEIKDKCCFIVN